MIGMQIHVYIHAFIRYFINITRSKRQACNLTWFCAGRIATNFQ